MTFRTRRNIFFIFLCIFIAVSIAVVYYTQGYRFDFQSGSVTRTGSLYIESYIRPISIYLNEKPYEDKSGILKKGTLISSILPKKYTVRIEKEGFIPYVKNIDIVPLQVARLFNVLLVPERVEPVAIFTNTGATKLISTEPSGRLLITGGKNKYFILENSPLNPPASLDSYIASLTKNTYGDFRFSPDGSGKVLATRNNTWYAIDTQTDTIAPLNIPRYAQVVTSNLHLFGMGIASATSTPKIPAKPATTTQMSVYAFPGNGLLDSFIAPFSAENIAVVDSAERRYAFLLENGDVWLRQDGGFEKIAHDAKQMLFSPDGYKLLIQDTDGTLSALLLRDEFETLNEPRGTMIRIHAADAKSIKYIQWYADSYHLLLGYPDRITLEELTYLQPDNQPVIRSGAYTSFLYEKNTNALFVLTAEETIEKIILDWK
jgi:hypothetical protein